MAPWSAAVCLLVGRLLRLCDSLLLYLVLLRNCVLLFSCRWLYFLSLRDPPHHRLRVLPDVDLLLAGGLVHQILGPRYLLEEITPRLQLTAWRYPALLVLLHPAHLIVLATVRALPLLVLYLVIVTVITNLIFAIARIELLLHILKISLAHVANIVPSDSITLAGEL